MIETRVGRLALSDVALAWLLRTGEDVIPLVGMGRPSNGDRHFEAMRVTLTDAEVAALDAAFLVGAASGTRYPAGMTASHSG